MLIPDDIGNKECFPARSRGKYFPQETENSKRYKLLSFFKRMILHIDKNLKIMFLGKFSEDIVI